MIIFWIISLLYVFFILFLLFGIIKIPVPESKFSEGKTSFSVVVPFRNETANLPSLFESFEGIYYQKELYEIILVNDASEDLSLQICREFKARRPDLDISIISSEGSSGSPKKEAVGRAIEAARNEFILTTDADCTVAPGWLKEMDSHLRKTNAKLVAGPVGFVDYGKHKNRSYLELFQEIDFLSLQAATMGGFGVGKPFLCNAANLCYEKQSFHEVEGFKGNDQVASGDDIFLLHKFEAAGLKTAFLKSREAMVTTLLQTCMRDLISQRVRWAAKSSAYKNNFGKGVGILVFLMNFSLTIGFLLIFLNILSLNTFLFFFLLKFNIDFVFIYRAAIFHNKESLMRSYFWCSIIYPFFSSYVVLKSLTFGYQWKGRSFKK